MLKWGRLLRAGVVVTLLGAATAATFGSAADAGAKPVAVLLGSATAPGIDKIKHIVVLMQENRSFDEYFGTYPGADGIPMDGDGVPTVCSPDPARGGICSKPFHDPTDANFGGPHSVAASATDINNGAMDGYITAYEIACKQQGERLCGDRDADVPDVMGYKLRSDIPNYYAYADNFVLQDRMFEPLDGPSLRAHLAMVSGWAAICSIPHQPLSCHNDDSESPSSQPDFAWTDITYLLDQNNVSWNYFVFTGEEPDCDDPGDLVCVPRPQDAKTGGYWNPLPKFDTVRDDHQVGNIQSVTNFAAAAQNGTLPAVSWVVPTQSVSDHPQAKVSDGQKYITYLMNTVMQGPDWDSTAIFLAWDDWGGFYDHVNPPSIDNNGYGLRVPGLLVSPYAKTGYIDHQTLSFDAYLRFIEDRFLGGARLDPETDGRPDNRPNVRENAPQLGDLRNEFDFSQPPRPPLILDTVPPSQLATPLKVPPKAKPTASEIEYADAAPVVGEVPLEVTFDGSQTSGAGKRATWSLDFGDGSAVQTGTGVPPASIAHTYTTAGDFQAVLSVSNEKGKTSVATLGVDTSDPAAQPTTWITGSPINARVGQQVKFDGSQSVVGGDWSVDFGDGTAPAVGTGIPPANLTHTYTTPGAFHTTLMITAAGGSATKATATTVVSAGAAPKVNSVGASAITQTSATITGRVNPNGAPSASFWFEWGPTAAMDNQTTPMDTNATGAFTADLTGLTPKRAVYFRIVASSQFGTSYGKILKFKTLANP